MITVPWWVAVPVLLLAAVGLITVAKLIGWRIEDRRANRATVSWWDQP